MDPRERAIAQGNIEGSLIGGAFLAVAGGIVATGPRVPAAACFVAGTLVALAATDGTAYAAIEEVQVGDRVVTSQMDEGEAFETEVTHEWQVIDLELRGVEEGKQKVVALTVLRAPTWLDEVDPDRDGAFELELEELRLRGIARVVQMRRAPAVAPGPGRVVLATVQHFASYVFALQIGGEEIRATGNHPFYSLARDAFVVAEELELGELVQTREGPLALVSRVRVDGEHAVFNLQVERDSEYAVGWRGTRVHNTYPRPLTRRQARILDNLRNGIDQTVRSVDEARLILENTGLRPFNSSDHLITRPAPLGTFRGDLVHTPWMTTLGAGQLEYMNRARHFVVCCYDEVIEVMAWEVSFGEEPR